VRPKILLLSTSTSSPSSSTVRRLPGPSESKIGALKSPIIDPSKKKDTSNLPSSRNEQYIKEKGNSTPVDPVDISPYTASLTEALHCKPLFMALLDRPKPPDHAPNQTRSLKPGRSTNILTYEEDEMEEVPLGKSLIGWDKANEADDEDEYEMVEERVTKGAVGVVARQGGKIKKRGLFKIW
jgi:hypothetical protein